MITAMGGNTIMAAKTSRRERERGRKGRRKAGREGENGDIGQSRCYAAGFERKEGAMSQGMKAAPRTWKRSGIN